MQNKIINLVRAFTEKLRQKHNARYAFAWAFLIAFFALFLWLIFHKYIEWQNLASQLGALERLKAENGNLATIAQICGGLFLLIGLCFTGWNAKIARMNMEISEDGKITDRFFKAIELIGNDKLTIRLGGIYALERIAIDSEKDHLQVMEVLTAFVRDTSHRENLITPKEKLDVDIQAILSVIGRRNSDHLKIETWRIDLRNTYLQKAFLYEANLARVFIQRSNLAKANFIKANLTETQLNGADLTGANFIKANLTETQLNGADLTGAVFTRANLTGAVFTGAKNLTIDQLSTVKTLYNVIGLDSTLLKQVQEKYPHLLEQP